MKLLLLSRSQRIPSTRRLLEAARERGHQVRVLNPTEVSVRLGRRRPGLVYRQRALRAPEVVVPRIAPSTGAYGLGVLDQLEQQGALSLNPATSIGLSRDPTRFLQRLSAGGLDIPATVISRAMGDLQALLETVGGVPVLVKLLGGEERRAAMLCESRQSLEAALEAVLGLGQDVLLQEHVRRGERHVRVYVVGGVALSAAPIAPRAGKRRGAQREAEPLTAPLRATAEQAARLLGLGLCAVDLLVPASDDRCRVTDVDAAPALPGPEACAGVDLAAAVISLAERRLAERPANAG